MNIFQEILKGTLIMLIIAVVVLLVLQRSILKDTWIESEEEVAEEFEELETSEWQTYRNEELGFEFRYPEDWIIINTAPFQPVRMEVDEIFLALDPVLQLLSPEEAIIVDSPDYNPPPSLGYTVSVHNAGETSISEWVERRFGNDSSFVDPQVTPVTFIDPVHISGNYNGHLLHQSGHAEGNYYVVTKNDRGYILVFGTSFERNFNSDIFKTLLNTINLF